MNDWRADEDGSPDAHLGAAGRASPQARDGVPPVRQGEPLKVDFDVLTHAQAPVDLRTRHLTLVVPALSGVVLVAAASHRVRR